MIWYFLESAATLPLLYAIIATIIEFRFSRTYSCIIIVLAIVTTLGSDMFFYYYLQNSESMYSYAWITTCIPSFLCLFYLARFRDAGFFFAYLTETILASIATSLAHILTYLLSWSHPISSIIFHVIILLIILWGCQHLFRVHYYEAAKAQGNRWFYYCVTPLMCLFIWRIYAGSPSRNFDIMNKVYIPYGGYIYPQDIPLLILMYFMTFYVVGLILVTITTTYRAETERVEKAALNIQSRALQDQLFALEKKDESLRILRHDMHHHFMALTGLIDSGAYSGTKKYLDQLDYRFSQTNQVSYCPNTVINAVVSTYANQAQQEEIRFETEINISENIPVDIMDIGAVLSNALENAFHASKKLQPTAERFISIIFIQHNKQFLLDISNSFNGDVHFNKLGHPVSQKLNHGIGSQSIYAFCRKYEATLDYMVKNQIFHIRIMFSN